MLEPRAVYVISDATGETAEKVVRAALLQFNATCHVSVHSRVRLESEVEKIVERAAERHALVVFTIVDSEERELLWQLCARHNVEAVDLIGGLMAKLTSYLGGETPKGVPGLLHTIGEDYFRRIEAVEFTVKNDDGAEPRNLPRADLVLVGISRTSKTPLSMFLANKGYRVANVPLVLGVDPPAELDQVPADRCYGLTIQPESLVKIRQVRLQHLGMPPDSSYGLRDHITRELNWAQEIFRKHADWPVIDVTGKAIEESAADILRIAKQRGRMATQT
jgi:regulator of PEP synthase PpsR (kinase-PPPase family)